MGRDDKILLIALAAGSALVAALLALALSLPWWAGVLLAVAMLACVAAYARRLVLQRRQEQLRKAWQEQQRPAPAAPEPEPDPFEPREVRDVPLPSREPDYRFTFTATVWWRRPVDAVGVGHENPAGLAVDTVLARAREITATEHPGTHEAVAHRLAGALGAVAKDRHGHIEAWAEHVALGLPGADAQRLQRLAEVRKDEQVWEQERNYERNKRAYLTEEVLHDTGSAVVWWLSRHEDDVERAAELIGTLAQLSAAATGGDIAEQFRHLVPSAQQAPFRNGRPIGADSLSFSGSLEGGRSFFSYGELPRVPAEVSQLPDDALDHVGGLLDELAPEAEAAERARLAGTLAELFESAGQGEFAESIRQRHAGEPADDGHRAGGAHRADSGGRSGGGSSGGGTGGEDSGGGSGWTGGTSRSGELDRADVPAQPRRSST